MNSNFAACKPLKQRFLQIGYCERETCPYLSTTALSREYRSMDGQQQQEGFAKLLLDSRVSIPHNAKHNYANSFFIENNGK